MHCMYVCMYIRTYIHIWFLHCRLALARNCGHAADIALLMTVIFEQIIKIIVLIMYTYLYTQVLQCTVNYCISMYNIWYTYNTS